MSQPWLDDLSEEWIPQEPSPAVSQSSHNPPAAQTSQSVPPKPHSRLPRLRHSSGSFSEINVRQIAKDLRPPNRSALAERSLSDNNVPSNTTQDASHLAGSRQASQAYSVATLDSVIYNGTVAQKPATKSPTKDQANHITPEWRRRLLNGERGYAEQKDLFSPMGLENIFQKPGGGIAEEVKQSGRKLGLLKELNMPSSPPPWPAKAHEEDGTLELGEQTDAPVDEQTWQKAEEHVPNTHHESSSLHAGESFSAIPLGGPRTVSGQIEFENENFSPVYLTTNLKVGATANPIPEFRGSELAYRLRQIETPRPRTGHRPATEPAAEDSSVSQPQGDSSFARAQDESLPEDLPAGTPDLADVGRFVEMRRGGYSRDGSFRTRPLSPSPQRRELTRSMLEEDTSPSNSSHTEAKVSDDTHQADVRPAANPLSPTTPHRHQQQSHLSPERALNSGSPLKLFAAHDTFTSNRLQRRLSQLEYKVEKTVSSSVQSSKAETKVSKQTTRMASVEEASMQNVAVDITNISPVRSEPRRIGTFGRGQLSQYQFAGDFSMLSSQGSDGLDSAPDESPSMDVAPPGSRQPIRFHNGSPESRQPSRAKRQGLTRVSNPFRASSQSKMRSSRIISTSIPKQELEAQHEYAEGKRGPTSPFKNPTPKRRRTLHSNDGNEDDGDVFSDAGQQSVKDSHVAMQYVIGRKRKDARHDHTNNTADPEVLARRHILRPRNPTPSQRRLDELHGEILEATDAFILSSPKLNTIREQLDSPIGADAPPLEERAAVVANEVAAFTMKRTAMTEESRKRSVTTQDFLDEAVKIMDYIRAKGRPNSGLGSLEESEAEIPFAQDPNPLPSTPLTFSRPPSREGRMSAWKEPNKQELDPNVMSHLRKFQEKESEDFMGSSFRSLRFSQIRGPSPQEDNSVVVEQGNIRITDNLDRHNAHGMKGDHAESQPRTNRTHPSTASSMGQTIVTSASRRSDHVATLAPEAVAHLIPEQIAGMSFDREKNMWVRQKSPSREHRPNDDHSANESEEDPFNNIPDLTVDETAEILMHTESPSRPKPTAETFIEGSEDDVTARPSTREGKVIVPPDTSSVPSKVSNFGWSFPKTETRATSWSDQGTYSGGPQKMQQPSTTYAIPESNEDDVEHEIKYFEGRGAAAPVTAKGRVRDITISIAEHDFTGTNEQQRYAKTPLRNGQPGWRDPSSRKYSKTSTWHQLNGTNTLPNLRRPTMEEHGELSVLEDLPSKNYHMQFSMNVSAPITDVGQDEALVPAPSSPVKGDVTFMLSDLPEFTLHQVDECELPNRVVVKHDGTRFSKALEDRYAQGTAGLVKALQDVEPDEPYWEDLREVDLHDKNLTNLHRLDEFCYRLEELDVSKNAISQVNGAPYTIRRLRAADNCLTGLTSWATLMNLQYLDISNNDIDSLDGLSELIHLRTLKVDGNKITSLDGILHLDGLIELSAGGNEIETVDFARGNMYASPGTTYIFQC